VRRITANPELVNVPIAADLHTKLAAVAAEHGVSPNTMADYILLRHVLENCRDLYEFKLTTASLIIKRTDDLSLTGGLEFKGDTPEYNLFCKILVDY